MCGKRSNLGANIGYLQWKPKPGDFKLQPAETISGNFREYCSQLKI